MQRMQRKMQKLMRRSQKQEKSSRSESIEVMANVMLLKNANASKVELQIHKHLHFNNVFDRRDQVKQIFLFICHQLQILE
mmetsp:Transcript_34959/g.39855  ORF Transcript_34959/g.39855 Transcript_34959/m.39855 type:complete len:80 (-) Transcript_34959:106-345(-)